ASWRRLQPELVTTIEEVLLGQAGWVGGIGWTGFPELARHVVGQPDAGGLNPELILVGREDLAGLARKEAPGAPFQFDVADAAAPHRCCQSSAGPHRCCQSSAGPHRCWR